MAALNPSHYPKKSQTGPSEKTSALMSIFIQSKTKTCPGTLSALNFNKFTHIVLDITQTSDI